MEQFFTVKQLAEILQVNPVTILDAIRDGELEALDIGRGYRISPDAFETFKEKIKVKKQPAEAKE